MRRPSVNEYFMSIAHTVASRSTCLDKQVGCVLVDKDCNILATGYNGAPRGMEHCTTCLVHETGDKNACPAAHAEQNAMLRANPAEVYACYCTLEPCVACVRMLLNTNCKVVYYEQETNSRHSGHFLWITAQQDRGSTTAGWHKFDIDPSRG